MSRTAILATGGAGAMVLADSYLVSTPLTGHLQLVAATLLLLTYLALTLRNPSTGLVVVAATIPFLGVFRRILYQQSPVQLDVLLLVIPAYTVLMLFATVVTHRDRFNALLRLSITTRLLLILLGLLALQIFNPLQGGLAVGLSGALFYLVPLAWFIIGRLYLTEQVVTRILTIFVVASLISAVYGLMQTLVGFPSFDAYWITHVQDYTALGIPIGTRPVVRALGPATSAAEYAAFLSCGLACFLALLIFRRQRVALVPAALLGLALVLESSRAFIVLVLAAFALLVALRQRSKRTAILVIVAFCGAGLYVYQHFSQTLYTVTPDSSSIQGLLAHQVNGLAHPFSQEYSTAQLHTEQIIGAIQSSLHNPLGFGLGVTTLSAEKFGGSSLSAEFDIMNVFVSGGILAGILYVAILYRTFRAGFALTYRYKRLIDVLPLSCVVVSFGEVLNGGYYSLMPFLWLFIAWIDCRATESLRPAHAPAVQRRVAVANKNELSALHHVIE